MIKQRQLAVFDFDDTLTTCDSLLVFLFLLKGVWKTFFWLVVSVFVTVFKFIFSKPLGVDFKGSIKAQWLYYCVREVSRAELNMIGHLLPPYMGWKEEYVTRFKKHFEDGDRILVATGALDVFIYHILDQKFPKQYHDVFCTEMAFGKDDRLTGYLSSDNRVRAAKTQMVKDYIQQHGPFEKVFVYGNLPSDQGILDLADESHIIPKDEMAYISLLARFLFKK